MEEYPDFEETCGYGSVTGILGANCRHSFTPFIPGVMERTYTDEQLKNIDPPPFNYDGKTYTHYEATQKQREIERTVRKWKRREAAATNPEDKQACQIRIRRLQKEYKKFSSAADLRTQPERMKAYVPKTIANTGNSAIINQKLTDNKFTDRLSSVYEEDAKRIVSADWVNDAMYSSPIGADAAEYIANNGFSVTFNYDKNVIGLAGRIDGKDITVFPHNNKDELEMSGTIIHELCHERYGWESTLEDEVNCRLVEIMHTKGYATDAQISEIVQFVKRKYPGVPEGNLYGY